MMETGDILFLVREAIMLALLMSLPLLGIVLLTSIFTMVIQSLTKVSESALSVVPRILAVMVTLLVAGPWMGSRVAGFAERVWILLQSVHG